MHWCLTALTVPPCKVCIRKEYFEKWVYSELAVLLLSSSLQDWVDLWSHMLGWLFFLMILMHENHSFHRKVLWQYLSTKSLLVCKLQLFCFQTFWCSCFRIFGPFWHRDSDHMPVSLPVSKKKKNKQAKAILPTSIYRFASQRLTEFQCRRDTFWFPVMLVWICLAYCTCSKIFLYLCIHFFKVNEQRCQQFTGKKKKYIAVHFTCVVWFVCIHFWTKSWFRKLNLVLAVLQVLLAKISHVTKTFELGVSCNVPFYLQCYLFQTGQFAPVPTTMPNKVRFLPQLSTTK